MAKPTEELLDLIFLTLDHAMKTLVGTNGPVAPFAIIESATGKRTLARFGTGGNPDEARQHARGHVSQAEDCARYAIAADGTTTENGQRIPVVMVEGGQRGNRTASVSYSVSQVLQRVVSLSPCGILASLTSLRFSGRGRRDNHPLLWTVALREERQP
jgi:hypothetical protein